MWAFTLALPMSPTYVIISIASFLSLVTKQQFFSGISSEFIVCVCSSGADISEALFLLGNGRVNQAFQNGIPGEHIPVFGNWSSDAYKRYPLPTKLHAAHCMSSALTTILIGCILVFFLDRYHFVGRFGWAETVFSLRILVVGERCNITGEYFERVPRLNKNCHRLSNVSWRILRSKQRILQSPMPNEHLAVSFFSSGF